MHWSKFAKIAGGFGVEGSKLLSILTFIALAGCFTHSVPEAVTDPQAISEARRVLVVYNGSSQQSEEIAKYYIGKRKIPGSNVVKVDCTSAEDISMDDYKLVIQSPVQARLRANKDIDFILLVKGIPIRLKVEQQYSVDATLAAMELPFKPIDKLEESDLKRAFNPYFNANEPFTHAKFGFYLVTRLDGYTTDDCKNLVDHSLLAKPEKGPFFFDEAENRKDPAYKPMQDTLNRSNELLAAKGFSTRIERTAKFVAPDERLAGYASWGSNDGAFNNDTYKQLRFKSGALVETFVSTSGRTFLPTTGGQSLIADLIANGVTGIKGYVSEPYTFALAKPDILFDRYTSGRNLAESFYAASMFLKWKDVVIGDPLCSPYAKK